MSILTKRSCSVTVPVPLAVALRLSAVMFAGVFMTISWLGALLDRVSPLCSGWPLSRLDSSYLVDLDLGLWRVLNVDVHQRRMERPCREKEIQSLQRMWKKVSNLKLAIL